MIHKASECYLDQHLKASLSQQNQKLNSFNFGLKDLCGRGVNHLKNGGTIT